MDSLIALVLIVLVVFFGGAVTIGLQVFARFASTVERYLKLDLKPKLSAEVDRKLASASDLRVCAWCSKTGVPAHVSGVLLAGNGPRDATWYCSKQCYRTGHGAS